MTDREQLIEEAAEAIDGLRAAFAVFEKAQATDWEYVATDDGWTRRFDNPDDAALVLVSKPLSQIVTFWHPGSADWSWAAEYADVMRRPETEAILERVNSEGIGFIDHVAPVLLGNDARVWDGHHRICIAIRLGIPSLMVEMVEDHDTTPKEEA